MKKYLPFVSIWLVSTVVIYLAALALPSYFELGSHVISELPGAFLSGLLIALFNWAAKPILASLGSEYKDPVRLFIFYWVSNFLAIWLVARFAIYTGFGIVSYQWGIGLALFMNLAQYVMWQILQKDKLVD